VGLPLCGKLPELVAAFKSDVMESQRQAGSLPNIEDGAQLTTIRQLPKSAATGIIAPKFRIGKTDG
jgi:hypothetical protein